MGYNISGVSKMNIGRNPNSVNYSNNICPDQYLCQIKYSNNCWQIVNKNMICSRRFSIANNSRSYVDYSCVPNDNYLILLLESPHIDEYDSNGNAYGPAQGKSGCNICRYLEQCLLNNTFLNKKLTYTIVLINSIQFQTSLGICPLNKNIRNQNWIQLINTPQYNDIDKRLQVFMNYQNTIIVNCCTTKLKKALNAMLLANKIKIIHSGYHPSSWWLPLLRKIK